MQQAVVRVRAEIAEAQQQMRFAREAALPKEDAKKLARAHVDTLAAEGRPRVKLAGGKLDIAFQKDDYAPNVRRMTAVAAWLHPDQFYERLCAEIDALPDPKLSLSSDAKRARVAELTESIDQLEREEEALIVKAEEDGIEILRRATASPLAVLGLRRAA